MITHIKHAKKKQNEKKKTAHRTNVLKVFKRSVEKRVIETDFHRDHSVTDNCCWMMKLSGSFTVSQQQIWTDRLALTSEIPVGRSL